MKIKNFKKIIDSLFSMIALSMLLTGIIQAEEKQNFIQRFSIKVSGGLSYLAVGDFNKFLEDVTSIEAYHRYVYMFDYFEMTKKEELKKVRFGFDSEIELTFDINSRWRIGLGTGYVYTSRASRGGFEISRPEPYSDMDFTYSPRISISAIPLKLAIYYIKHSTPKAKWFVNAGIGYYFTKTSYYWEQREILIEKDGLVEADWKAMAEWDLSSSGIGFHGGVGFEYNLTKKFALVIEAQGSYAQVKKLKGDEIYVGGGSMQNYYGAVYYWEEKDIITEKYYASIGFHKEKPNYSPPEYRNLKEAALGLSGFLLKIGIRIRLF